MKTLALVFSLLSSVAFGQLSQTATPVQQTTTRADASTNCVNAAGTNLATITITPANNQFVYITYMAFAAQATSAPAAGSVTTTTTNLGGLSRVCGLTAVAGISCENLVQPATPIRSATLGSAVTIVSNATFTNVTFTLTACYYLAQ